MTQRAWDRGAADLPLATREFAPLAYFRSGVPPIHDNSLSTLRAPGPVRGTASIVRPSSSGGGCRLCGGDWLPTGRTNSHVQRAQADRAARYGDSSFGRTDGPDVGRHLA